MHLTINTNKTKIVIFGNGGKSWKKWILKINKQKVEIVQTYVYLGIPFHATSILKNTQKTSLDKASPALTILWNRLIRLKMHNLHHKKTV